MPDPAPRRESARRTARRVTCVATALALVALAAVAGMLATARDADGTATHGRVVQQRLHARAQVTHAIARAAAKAPVARNGRCTAGTVEVPGQGASCRTSDGLWLVPDGGGGEPLATHGPDLVDASAPTTGRRGRSGGFGTTASILCSAPSQTRHVQLAYIVPADFGSGSTVVHGDRFPEIAPQLRQALLDAATVVDRRAGELVPGARRRLRVLCDDSGAPVVDRIVLPRTANEYLAPSGGFSLIGKDLAKMGVLPTYAGFSSAKLPAVLRVLGYYDAEFVEGVAGQGTMFRRSSLLRNGVSASSPLVSKTVRNINNNPPDAPFALQYGSSTDGVPDPPLYTSLLHELSHTMGAVQDEPPTSSDAGHCKDGLDVMCYDDGGTGGGSYAKAACPAAVAGAETPEDERFDCNGDTYFHPAPPAGNPLAAATTWQLGLPANEALATTAVEDRPARVASLAARGTGTQIVLRWPAVTPLAGRGYEVAYRAPGEPWRYVTTTKTAIVPPLRPGTRYELAVGAVSTRTGALGPRALATTRTGSTDTSPPTPPGAARQQAVTRSSVQLAFTPSTDNVRVTRYRVERLVGSRWVLQTTIPVTGAGTPPPGTTTATTRPINGLRPATSYRMRLRAVDARGNASLPSRVVVVRTAR